MSLVIPPEMKPQLTAIFKHLGGQFARLLEHELETTYRNLADASDETLMRQMQGRARFIRDLLDQIAAAQG